MPTLLDALDQIVATDPARPLLTWYRADDRVELSGATVANWVAKTAGLLRDEMDVQPGDHVHVSMGPHWLAAVLPLGIWRVGAVLNGPEAAYLLSDRAGAETAVGESVLLPTDAFAMLAPTVPAGWVDFVTAIRVQPDRFTGPLPTDADLAYRDETHGGLWAAARRAGRALSLAPGGRLLHIGSQDPTGANLQQAMATTLVCQGSLATVYGDDESLPGELATHTVHSQWVDSTGSPT